MIGKNLSVGCLFTFLMMSFEKENILILMMSNLSVRTFGVRAKKSHHLKIQIKNFIKN